MARGRKYNKSIVSSAATSTVSSAVSTAVSTPISSRYPSRASSPGPSEPFRFFDLPSELRLRVYELVLVNGEILDLHPLNYRYIRPQLALFLVSRRVHEEAYRVFYSQPLRLFPVHGRFFHDKKALVERLSPRYRAAINSLELRLGPGWSKPPRCQHVKPSIGLMDCTSLRTLKVFVECDPSDNVFAGFRGRGASEDTYKWFCLDLLQGIIEQVPSLETIEIDAYPGVKKDAPLIMTIKRKAEEAHKRLAWGPLRGWEKEGDEPGLIGLEKAMSSMGLGDVAPNVVAVQA